MKYFILLISFLAFSLLIHSQDHQSENFLVYYPQTKSPIAVCLLIHGLNNKPSSMQWIRKELLKQSAVVVQVELWGHGNNPIEIADSMDMKERMSQFKQVNWEQWLKDTRPAINFIDSAFHETSIPRYFFGFSLGGLVGASIGIEYDFRFDGYFLLAPAIKIRSMPKLLIKFISPFPNKVIKSRAPERYRENRGTPVAAYKALLKGAKQFKKAQPYLSNCIIIIDKKDRLVSAKKLSKLATENKYKMEVIRKEKNDCSYCGIKHLIIDKESLGSFDISVFKEIKSFFNRSLKLAGYSDVSY